MVRFLLFAFFFIAALNARENPFFPSSGEKDIPYTSNENNEILPLKRATIALPPQARVLQSVTIHYKNLDGSQESKSIELENFVDWHLPIFISQSYTSADTPAEDKTKVITKDKKTEKTTTESQTNTDENKFKQIASTKNVTFSTYDKYLKIVTKDKIIRNFLLVQPHRIVLDLKSDASVKTYEENMSENIFTKIRVGNHEGFYRVVIELDGYYKYKFKDTEDGYIFELL